LRKRIVVFSLIGYFGLFALVIGALGYGWVRDHRAPEQPIAFPHTIHAGQLGLPCTYCHLYVEKSRQAGAPYLETCMGCHRNVATDKPEIKKLAQYYESNTPIEWNRIHNLPEFVYFSHKRHIKAGLDCSACHGEMRGTVKVRQVRSLKMGWCVTCHKAKGAPRDCATCHK
jgi:hypothetical protein